MSLNAPGLPGSQAANDGDIMRMIQDLQRDLRELRAANPFAPMGMTPQANGVVFSGSVEIDGNLSVPNGSISNAALVAPVVISTTGLTQNNFATSKTASVYAAATVTVPAGYSQADVLCMVAAGAINSTTAGDFIYVASYIGSSINVGAGGETPQYAVGSGGYASAAANGIRSLAGLVGGTITVGCQIRTGAAGWAASASNFANVNAVIFFRR